MRTSLSGVISCGLRVVKERFPVLLNVVAEVGDAGDQLGARIGVELPSECDHRVLCSFVVLRHDEFAGVAFAKRETVA